MRERRKQLDAVARAIEQTEELLRSGRCDWECIVGVIQVIQMEQNTDWRRKYFTEEQMATMEDLRRRSYSEEAYRRMSVIHPNEWTEEDQKRVDQRYAALHAGVRRLVSEGGDPASPEAQALAGESIQLLNEFTGGDPEIASGLSRLWENYQALPDEQKPFPPALSNEECEFLERAKAIYRQGQQGAGG